MRLAKLGKRGSEANNWQGGVCPINSLMRGSQEYRDWRNKVFARDGYACTWCRDDKGGNLEADHIKQWAYYPELRFELTNGRTLCRKCHRLMHQYRVDISKSDLILTQ